jgi:hypothetical protein
LLQKKQNLLSFALIIGTGASPILGCHSGGILFQSSTVLITNKMLAAPACCGVGMTFSFYPFLFYELLLHD